MSDALRLEEALRGKLVRLFMDYMEGENPDYVYVTGCYDVGGECVLIVEDYEGYGFRVVKMSEVETIDYYKSDEDDQ